MADPRSELNLVEIRIVGHQKLAIDSDSVEQNSSHQRRHHRRHRRLVCRDHSSLGRMGQGHLWHYVRRRLISWSLTNYSGVA